MPSIHVLRSMEKAAEKGAYAGTDAAFPLWDYSKRELIEIALRFGEMMSDDSSLLGAVDAVQRERTTLKSQDII